MKGFLSCAFVVSTALIFGVMVFGLAAGYRVNVTPSLPLGVYRVTAVRHAIRYGELVTFTLPSSLRLHRWLGRFTKPVAGLPGDHVCVHNGELRVNGVDYGPVLPEAPAHALLEGECETVPEGFVFTASDYPRSYDSRYFGAIQRADVRRTIAVWTWGD